VGVSLKWQTKTIPLSESQLNGLVYTAEESDCLSCPQYHYVHTQFGYEREWPYSLDAPIMIFFIQCFIF